MAHPASIDHLAGDLDAPQEMLEGVATATGGYQLSHLGPEIVILRLTIEEDRWLERAATLGIARAGGCRMQGQHGPRREPVGERGTTNRPDQRVEILDLALDRVWRGVAALAASAAVVGQRGEFGREGPREVPHRAKPAGTHRPRR